MSLIFFAIASPCIAACVALVTKRRVVMEAATIIASVVVLVSAALLALIVAEDGTYSRSAYFSVDALGALVIATIAVVGCAAAFYSVAYIREEAEKKVIGNRRTRQYFLFFNIFVGAMLFASATANPILMWIAIEATTLSTAFLISFYNKPSAMEAAWKYLIINSVGLLLGFFGTLLYFTSVEIGGSMPLVDWNLLSAHAGALDPAIAKIAFIFVLIGYGTKVGFAPMHTWKPDAYGKAPTPIAALFSGALLNVALAAVLRFKAITDSAVGPEFTGQMLIILGLLSVGVAAFIMFAQRNYKRLLAYSSIEHAGIMALGFGFGGIGALAASLHMVYHSLAKAILFFAAGNIFLKYSSTKILNVKGALRAIPVTSVLFIFGFLAASGIPPLGLFLTKAHIAAAGMALHPVAVIVAVLALIVAFVAFLKHTHSMMFGEKPEEIDAGELSAWLLIPSFVLAAVFIYVSVYPPAQLYALVNAIAAGY
ncbi:MAG: proton-conducting transporter membrane subunit [Patescibacteria group bacterium]